jgi:hypothetical protein
MQLKFGALSFWTRKSNGAIVADEGATDAAAKYRADAAKFSAVAVAPGAASGAQFGARPMAGTGEEIAGAVVRHLREPLRTMIRQELAEKLASKEGDRGGYVFPVDAASSAWQNSGVRVKAGQRVVVETAEGEKWDPGWGPIDARGYLFEKSPNVGLPLFHKGNIHEDWHWGSLICSAADGVYKVDNTQNQVEVGVKREFTVDSDGYLYFICNDSRALPNGMNGYFDDIGIIHVKISVSDPTSDAGEKTNTQIDQEGGKNSP